MQKRTTRLQRVVQSRRTLPRSSLLGPLARSRSLLDLPHALSGQQPPRHEALLQPHHVDDPFVRLELRRNFCRVVLEEDVVVARSGARVLRRGDKVDEARRGAGEEREDGVRALGEGLRAARQEGREESARRSGGRGGKEGERRTSDLALSPLRMTTTNFLSLKTPPFACTAASDSRPYSVLVSARSCDPRPYVPRSCRKPAVRRNGRQSRRAPCERAR